jgi:hypothetical protein
MNNEQQVQGNETNQVQAEENVPQPLPAIPEEGYPTRLPIIIKGVKPSFTYGILALTIAVFILQEGSAALIGFDWRQQGNEDQSTNSPRGSMEADNSYFLAWFYSSYWVEYVCPLSSGAIT